MSVKAEAVEGREAVEKACEALREMNSASDSISGAQWSLAH